MKRVFAAALLLWFFSAVRSTAQVGFFEPPTKQEMERGERVRARIEAALQRHREIPAVQEMIRHFSGKTAVTSFVVFPDGGIASRAYSDAPLSSLSGMLEVVLFDPRFLHHPRINGNRLFYVRDWGAVFVIDAAFPDNAWFDAFLIHEMYHALQDRKGAPGAHAPNDSEEWIGEEVEAHDLEREVLDHATRGAYRAAIGRILSSPSTKNTEAEIYFETEASHAALGSLFIDSADEALLRAAQYQYDIIATWVEQRFSILRWQKEKINVYRSIRSAE